MKALVVDTETTTFMKGNPFAQRNKLCYVGAWSGAGPPVLVGIDGLLGVIHDEIRASELLIFFNAKFDLHWLRRAGLGVGGIPVWDCQLAYYLLTHQKNKYPSLDDVLLAYGLPPKDPVVEQEYWSKGIDTPDIPPEIMRHYLTIDLEREWAVYEKQRELFAKGDPRLYQLFRLQCEDLKVLAEMEFNGLRINTADALAEAKVRREELESVEQRLAQFSPAVVLNWDSPDDVSALLYGGVVHRERRVVVGVYMSGQKIGQPRHRIHHDEFPLPGVCKPIKGSELEKPGVWSTAEDVLKQLKGREARAITELLIQRQGLVKILERLEGEPKLIEKYDWEPDVLHGSLNQCVVITGRLSATQPNQQNWDDNLKQFIVSEYID